MVLCMYLDKRLTVSAPMAITGWVAYLTWNVISLMWSANPFYSQV